MPGASFQSVSFAGLTLDRPRLMGVINATPDSFSDGGDAFKPQDAIDQGLRQIAEGADILDIGGESTRPGAAPVSMDEELRRVLPVIDGLRDKGAKLSIDSRHAEVMRQAVEAGADIINDVAALRGPGALETAAVLNVAVVLMHMQGEPRTMQAAPHYQDVVAEVIDFLRQRIDACVAVGLDKSQIAIDPGIGFGKTLEHNLALLRNLAAFEALGCPVLLGVSRKSYIAKISTDAGLGEPAPKDRVPGTLATALAAYDQGVRMFRVHDVAAHAQALAVHSALAEEGPAGP